MPDRIAPDAARSLWLAGAAHDLRQPLDALAIYVELLAADPGQASDLAPRMARALRALRDAADALSELGALDAGVAPPRVRDVALQELLADLATVHEPLARRKGLRLRVRGAQGTLRSDPAWLRRALGNLLANAIRYTERGGVLLAARPRAGRVVFEVWDTGRGIAAADQLRVFEPFVRLASAGADPGAGLGLAIVRMLARGLDAELTLRSRPARGSVFRLALKTRADR